MTEEMKVNYGDIDIRYRYQENDWEFELRGKTRYAKSLKQAQEAIDKIPSPKRKEFSRIEAYKRDSGGRYIKVTVTSYAGKGWRGHEYWILLTSPISGKGDRRKVSESELHPITYDTDATVGRIHALQEQINSLILEREKLERSLPRLVPNEDQVKQWQADEKE